MRRKKVLITTGIVIGILAIVVGVIMIIVGKEEKIECPVTGAKLGMSWEEVEKKLKEKEIEWTEGGTQEEKWVTVSDIYSDFFEMELQVIQFTFSEENKLEQIKLYTVSRVNKNKRELFERIEEKVTTYYTKKYGNPKVKELNEYDFDLYYWETDDWSLWIDWSDDNFWVTIEAY